ncbi:MAG: GNAT family N-acetyltransferase [Omnitrophica WOR_2 bacterium]
MDTKTRHKTTILRDLGGGLILRRSIKEDSDELAALNAEVFQHPETKEPDRFAAEWVRDLMDGHPAFKPDDFTVVVDTATGRIVSSMNLIPQTWSYAGIPFKVGRPELVITLPEYRNRGLVRAQFETVHQWCLERGLIVQGITGIPYYYRQFGYEMCLELSGGRRGFLAQIPKLKEGQSEPYLVRPAEEQDIPFMAELYDQSQKRYLIRSVRDMDQWRYEFKGKRKENGSRLIFNIITTPQGETVGFLAHPPFRWGTMMVAQMYEIKAGLSWAAVTPSVLRYLQSVGENLPSGFKSDGLQNIGFWMGTQHPVYEVVKYTFAARRAYAWYIRVPDLPGFMRLISPVLEQRLAQSSLSGHSGEVKLTFYRDGLRMVFDQGQIKEVAQWKPAPVGGSGDAAFPGLTFLRVLFGYNTVEELREFFPDCWMDNDEVLALLSALFRKQASDLWAAG